MKFTTTAFSGKGGNVANTTVQLKGSQYHAKSKVVPRIIRTPKTLSFRQKWSLYSNYWADFLDPTIKANWNAWAATWPYENGLPPNTFMTGFNWFFRNLNKTGDPTFINNLNYDPGTWARPTPLNITEYNYDETSDITKILGSMPDGASIDGGVLQVYGQNPFSTHKNLYPSRFRELFVFSPAVGTDGVTIDIEISGDFTPTTPPWTSPAVQFFASTTGNLSYALAGFATRS